MLEEKRRGGSLGWTEASSLRPCSVRHCSEPPGSCLEGGPVRSAKGPGCYKMTQARTLGKWSEIIFSSEGEDGSARDVGPGLVPGWESGPPDSIPHSLPRLPLPRAAKCLSSWNQTGSLGLRAKIRGSYMGSRLHHGEMETH